MNRVVLRAVGYGWWIVLSHKENAPQWSALLTYKQAVRLAAQVLARV